MRLLILFVAVPILEIALFVQIGGSIGIWPTIAIVLLTAALGTFLVRAQGLQTLKALQLSLENGVNPIGPLANGALILVAGLLLLTPGFFTDAVALSLLLPVVRRTILRWGASRLTLVIHNEAARRADSHHDRRSGREPNIVDAEYEVITEEQDRSVTGSTAANPASDVPQEPGGDDEARPPARPASRWARPPP